MAYIAQASVVEKDLLHNEDCYGFAKLRAGLHDSQAERYDLSRQEKVDDLGRVVLDQCTDNTKRCQAQILEWP